MAEKNKKSDKNPDNKTGQKSVFQVAHELEQQQREQEQTARALAQKQKEQQRLAHEEQLRRDKLELIRLKQGIITESETIHEEQKEQKSYTIGQRISDFFYHNTWWMGIGGFLVALTAFFIWQIATTVHPDLIILLVADNDLFAAACADGIEDIFSSYIEDINQDGKIVTEVYYIPASEEKEENSGYTGDNEKLKAEFQIGEAVLVISDQAADAFIVPEHTLVNLEEDFGDYEETKDMRFMLADTDFADALEWDMEFDEDMYIGIRQVRETLQSKEKMQEVYDVSFPALRQFIQEFGHKK